MRYLLTLLLAALSFNAFGQGIPQIALESYQQGDKKYMQENFEGAISDFTDVIRRAPEYSYAFVYRGLAHEAIGDFEKALNDYNQAIQLNSDLYGHYNRGLCLMILGNYQTAISDFTKAILFAPDNFEAYMNRGACRFHTERYGTAIDDFKKVMELAPNNALAYFNRGRVYDEMGRYKAAIDDYTRAISKCKDSKASDSAKLSKRIGLNVDTTAEIYYSRGLIYYKQESFRDALSDYTMAININTQYTEAYINRGLTFDALGNYQSAISNFTIAINLSPNSSIAYFNRAISKAKLKRPFCNDCKKACSLGWQESCDWYSRQCM